MINTQDVHIVQPKPVVFRVHEAVLHTVIAMFLYRRAWYWSRHGALQLHLIEAFSMVCSNVLRVWVQMTVLYYL